MSVEIKAPQFPESIQDGTIATWHKSTGENVLRDELIVDIETDKVVLEVVAPANGILAEILKPEGETVLSGEVIAKITEGEVDHSVVQPQSSQKTTETKEVLAGPAAKKIAEENGLNLESIAGSGKDGRITKADVLSAINQPQTTKTAASSKPAAPSNSGSSSSASAAVQISVATSSERTEKRVPMTRIRKRIAERLLDVTRETAMLTTFNEVNMEPVIRLRNKYKDQFEKTHNGTRLGFMSFFVKACVEALKRSPIVNASIDGDDIVYHGYQDIGVAVSTDKGLVVPVLKDADTLGLADIENRIRDFGAKAREGKLSIDDMTGGTFTITNGGVYGSMMSTPILNPPQSAILGMHKIQERPVAVNGEIKILPMMYLALSYDHRLLDGKDAVKFLVLVKDMIEDPARILLEI
ncbi:MAG: 2-oxoglutarate dehydrogenase complex dihydrolipoyllysine-residue succinyltransferase [Pseudomonadales bacterium]|nr:2-oxoglutarate dehydrogenase complex dihydrolipoyllysine-residue succinyltransferase [Pseudomonadales bacterium]